MYDHGIVDRRSSFVLMLQIFELWERPGAAREKPHHYVKCIYNNNELSLAHHPNGVLPSCVVIFARARYRQRWLVAAWLRY